jgi:hypothetical protein
MRKLLLTHSGVKTFPRERPWPGAEPEECQSLSIRFSLSGQGSGEDKEDDGRP